MRKYSIRDVIQNILMQEDFHILDERGLSHEVTNHLQCFTVTSKIVSFLYNFKKLNGQKYENANYINR
ncbi:hypothetical protein ACH3XW_17650 [Acanthocheilonema viteae]